MLPLYQLVAAIANVYAAIGALDFGAAEDQLKIADELARRLNRGRDALTLKVLRAVVARQRNDRNALASLSEVLSLAAIGGIDRLLVDTHPIAVEMGAELQPPARAGEARADVRRTSSSERSPQQTATPRRRSREC